MAQQTRNPTGDGTFTGTWTGTAGSRWQSVNDHPDPTGASKLTHGTTAGKGTFTYSAFTVPTNSSVTNIQVLYYDEKTASQAASWGAFLRVNGADQATNDAHNPANVTWTLRTATYTTNPATGLAWTVADVNGTGSSPLQGFGLVATDASPTCEVASIQLVVNYTPPTATRGLISWAEFEAPFVPTRGQASWAEFEVPAVPVATRGLISWSELEVPFVPTRGRISFTELEIPVVPTRGRLSWTELEVPFIQTVGRISWAELEVPITPTRGLVSWAEFEIPTSNSLVPLYPPITHAYRRQWHLYNGPGTPY